MLLILKYANMVHIKGGGDMPLPRPVSHSGFEILQMSETGECVRITRLAVRPEDVWVTLVKTSTTLYD